jgi:hypothetical protein
LLANNLLFENKKLKGNFFFVKVCLTSILQKPLDQIKAAPLLRFCGSTELAEAEAKRRGHHPLPA